MSAALHGRRSGHKAEPGASLARNPFPDPHAPGRGGKAVRRRG